MNPFKVFANRKMFTVLMLGFASGLPLSLVGSTLQAWLASEKVDLALIGVFSLVGLPYTLKFLWAPAMDRFIPPFLGRRRGWILLTQFALLLSLATLATLDPVLQPGVLGLVALVVAFCAASQDVVIDAYRVELLKPEERGAGVGVSIMGYRLAMIISGAGSLILSDHLSWRGVYWIMATFFALAAFVTSRAPEPKVEASPPKSIRDAVIFPFLDFFKRRGALEGLLFIVFYKLGDVMAGAMTMPMMIDLGFSRSEIGAVQKGLGLLATIGGSLLGGAWMVKLGQFRSLLLFGICQGVSNLMFLVLALNGRDFPTLISAIVIENFCSGMGTVAFTSFMMSLCNARFSASQYALLSSLMAVSRVIVGAPTGLLAKNLGWPTYFAVCSAMAAPGLLMLLRFKVWGGEKKSV